MIDRHLAVYSDSADRDDAPPQNNVIVEYPSDFYGQRNVPAAQEAGEHRFFARTISSFGPFEWVTFSYLTWLEAIFVLFHRNLPHTQRCVAIHLAIGVVIVLIARAASRWQNPVLQFVRHWYPLP